MAIPSFIGAAGFAASAFVHSPVPSMIALTIAAVGDMSTRGAFWTLPARFLTGSALAAGIAFINTFGALGGFVGPTMVGYVREETGSFAGGLMVLAGLLVRGRRRHAVIEARSVAARRLATRLPRSAPAAHESHHDEHDDDRQQDQYQAACHYCSFALTRALTAAMSARPWAAFFTWATTLPMSFMEAAPVVVMAAAISASTSASLMRVGR